MITEVKPGQLYTIQKSVDIDQTLYRTHVYDALIKQEEAPNVHDMPGKVCSKSYTENM